MTRLVQRPPGSNFVLSCRLPKNIYARGTRVRSLFNEEAGTGLRCVVLSVNGRLFFGEQAWTITEVEGLWWRSTRCLLDLQNRWRPHCWLKDTLTFTFFTRLRDKLNFILGSTRCVGISGLFWAPSQYMWQKFGDIILYNKTTLFLLPFAVWTLSWLLL